MAVKMALVKCFQQVIDLFRLAFLRVLLCFRDWLGAIAWRLLPKYEDCLTYTDQEQKYSNHGAENFTYNTAIKLAEMPGHAMDDFISLK